VFAENLKMSDSKYFQRGKVNELLSDLQAAKGKNVKQRKTVMKKVIANMTMGNDMLPLAEEVLQMISIPDVEMKKMIYLYIVTYCRINPEIANAAFTRITAVNIE
jgi:vesicle coat complex subunit